MATLKHIASKNTNYGKALEYLMFEHGKNGQPVRNAEGDMVIRGEFRLDGINCAPFTFDLECGALNRQYNKNKKRDEIKSHHYIISFDPKDREEGLIDMDGAQKIGMEFAARCFPGHQMLVCTHDDGHNRSGNVHVHIIMNSLRKLDVEKQGFMEREIDSRAGYKHHLTKDYLKYLQEEVMRICRRENLRQVNLLGPAKVKVTDAEYHARESGQKALDGLNEQIRAANATPARTVFQTQKHFLRDAIQDAAGRALSQEEFEKLLKEGYGIEVKDRRGRFSYLHPERKKYITGRALGSDFEKEVLLEKIRQNARVDRDDVPNRETAYDPTYDYHADPVAIFYVRSNLRLVTDLQTNIKAQQSAAYARKVKLTNLKEMAMTLVFLQEYGYGSYEDLAGDQKYYAEKLSAAEAAVKETGEELRKTNEQIHFAGRYYAARPVQADFLKAWNKKKFRAEHREKLDQYDEAVRYFRENNSGSIPAMKQLKQQKEELLAEKDRQEKEVRSLKDFHWDLRTALANVDRILETGNVAPDVTSPVREMLQESLTQGASAGKERNPVKKQTSRDPEL